MKVACITFAFIFAVVCFVDHATANDQAPSSNSQPAEVDSLSSSLDSFRGDLRALKLQVPQAWGGQFPEAASMPAATKQAARDLTNGMLQWLERKNQDQAIDGPQLISWSSIFNEAFALRTMLEWQDFDPPWQMFRSIEHDIAQNMKHIGQEDRAKSIAALAAPILHLWLATHANELAPWIESFESQWLVDEAGKLPTWWLRDRCDYSLALTGPGSDANSHALGEKWILAFLSDTSVSVNRRAYVLTRFALHMHNLGKSDTAVEFLNQWEKQYPDACLEDVRFLHASFFVHQIGQGNRLEARRMLDRLDQLVESGEISAEDDRFRIITQNYYRNLSRSDVEHAMLTSQLLKSRTGEANE